MQNPYSDENEDLPVGANQQPLPATATYPYYEYGAGSQRPTAPQGYNTAPGQFEPDPVPPTPARSVSSGRSGMRTGAILALALVLALVFGTGLFAGWQFGRTSNSSSPRQRCYLTARQHPQCDGAATEQQQH